MSLANMLKVVSWDDLQELYETSGFTAEDLEEFLKALSVLGVDSETLKAEDHEPWDVIHTMSKGLTQEQRFDVIERLATTLDPQRYVAQQIIATLFFAHFYYNPETTLAEFAEYFLNHSIKVFEFFHNLSHEFANTNAACEALFPTIVGLQEMKILGPALIAACEAAYDANKVDGEA